MVTRKSQFVVSHSARQTVSCKPVPISTQQYESVLPARVLLPPRDVTHVTCQVGVELRRLRLRRAGATATVFGF